MFQVVPDVVKVWCSSQLLSHEDKPLWNVDGKSWSLNIHTLIVSDGDVVDKCITRQTSAQRSKKEGIPMKWDSLVSYTAIFGSLIVQQFSSNPTSFVVAVAAFAYLGFKFHVEHRENDRIQELEKKVEEIKNTVGVMSLRR